MTSQKGNDTFMELNKNNINFLAETTGYTLIQIFMVVVITGLITKALSTLILRNQETVT